MLKVRKLSLLLVLWLPIILAIQGFSIPDAEGFDFKCIPPFCDKEPVPTQGDECVELLNSTGWDKFIIGMCELFGSCEKVELKVRHAPEINLSKYQTVAFSKFEGDFGDAFSASYREQVQRDSHLKVFDRTQLLNLIKDQKISESDLLNPEVRKILENLLPAGLLVTGKIETNFEESPLVTETFPCLLDKKKTCMKTTRTGVATMKGVVSIIDVETGHQLKDKRLFYKSKEENVSHTSKPPEQIDQQTVQEINLQMLVKQMATASIPTTENRKVVFYKDSDLRQLDVGILMAKGGRLDEAEKNFSEAIHVAEEKGLSIKSLSTARYNLAILKVYRGDYGKAESLLKQVLNDTLDVFPVDIILKIMDCLKEEDKRKQEQNIE
jgi:tetratricopeptide (TPR) repeat protein